MLSRVHVKPFLIRWMINTIALSAAVQVIPGIHFPDGPLQLLAVAPSAQPAPSPPLSDNFATGTAPPSAATSIGPAPASGSAVT